MRLRLTWAGPRVTGAYKAGGDWVPVGDLEVPSDVAGGGFALACHGGLPEADRWAKFTDFRVIQGGK